MPDKIIFQNLSIEVTRRCNMNCAHCLRGDAQSLDLQPEYLTKLLKKTKKVMTTTLTGGEPSIAVNELDEALASFKITNTELSDFYVVTNGKVVSNDFLLSLIKWYSYCDNNEISGVSLSQDKFHEKVPLENIKKLEALSFFEKDGHKTDWDEIPLLAIGRGKNFKNNRPAHDLNSKIYYEEYTEDGEAILDVDDIMALTCTGDILRGCDYDYNDIQPQKITNVNKPKWFNEFVDYIYAHTLDN